jgi:hypothetical protein
MGKETGGQRGEERDGERSMNGLTKKTGEVVKFSLMGERVDDSKVFKRLMSGAEGEGLRIEDMDVEGDDGNGREIGYKAWRGR